MIYAHNMGMTRHRDLSGEAGFAASLRKLRSSRRRSIRSVAEISGVGKSTISRWERGTSSPSLPELQLVLNALDADPKQCAHWVTSVRGDSDLETLRSETNRRLIRAIRLRNGLSLTEAARNVGVTKATLSRWENGERCPDEANVAHAIKSLGATPLEVQAVEAGIVHEGMLAKRLDLHEIRWEVDSLRRQIPLGHPEPLDLPFIRIDQALRYVHSPEATTIRVLARGAYVEWLGWWYRDGEAAKAVEGLLHQFDRHRSLPVWGRIVRAKVNYLVETERDIREALRLSDWAIDGAIGTGSEGFLRRERAGRYSSMGQFDRALDEVSRAENSLNEEDGAVVHGYCCKIVRATTLSAAGLHEQAIHALPDAPAADPYLRVSSAISFSEVYERAGYPSESLVLLRSAYTEAVSQGLRHFAGGLSARLESGVGA